MELIEMWIRVGALRRRAAGKNLESEKQAIRTLSAERKARRQERGRNRRRRKDCENGVASLFCSPQKTTAPTATKQNGQTAHQDWNTFAKADWSARAISADSSGETVKGGARRM